MKKYKINLAGYIDKKIARRTAELIHKWFESKGVEDIFNEKMEFTYEKVHNYSAKIYTIRYDSQLVLRRFPDDLDGTAYRFEVYY